MDKIYLIHVPFLGAWWGNMVYLAWEGGQGPFALYQVSEKAILASETWYYPTYCPRVWPCPKGYQGAMSLLRGDWSMVCSGFPDMPLRAIIQAWASGSPKSESWASLIWGSSMACGSSWYGAFDADGNESKNKHSQKDATELSLLWAPNRLILPTPRIITGTAIISTFHRGNF